MYDFSKTLSRLHVPCISKQQYSIDQGTYVNLWNPQDIRFLVNASQVTNLPFSFSLPQS